MIFYGTNSTAVNQRVSQVAVCPSCGQKGTLTFHVLSEYAHLYWVPVFPTMKRGFSECSNCGQVLKQREMPPELRNRSQLLKKESNTPKWTFAGLAIIAVIICAVVGSSIMDDRNTELYAASPEVGDIYSYKTDGYAYSTFMILELTKDSVVVAQNDYEINRQSAIHEIDLPENYQGETYITSREDLKEWFETGEIFHIDREEE